MVCNVCNIDKPVSEFYFRKDNNKYNAHCKKCKPLKGRKFWKERTSKVCTHCGIEKPLSDYQKAGGKWHQPYCKPCDAVRKKVYNIKNEEKVKGTHKKYYNENKEIISKKQKEYNDLNQDKVKKRTKIYYEKNIDKIKYRSQEYAKKNHEVLLLRKKQYYWNNVELFSKNGKIRRSTPEGKLKKYEQDKKYRENNREKLAKKKKEYYVKCGLEKSKERQRKMMEDISFRIKKNLRGRIYVALKRGIKSKPTMELLGCTIEYFKEYFQSLFTEGMTWDKYMAGEIDIDHIRPCKSFDLTDANQQKECFHWSNMQPLWRLDNLRKASRYEEKLTA